MTKIKHRAIAIIVFFAVTVLAEKERSILRQIQTFLFEQKIQNFHFLFLPNVSDEHCAELIFTFDQETATTKSFQKW
jgi:hypothetical protein